ncbi:MAG: type II toxin-antitoxin system Phd/YefM family antitoxin [Candidatus Levyibacteriota bacterium]
MITVTAKQLRENLSAYLDRMEAGEEVAVIRHSKIIAMMAPIRGEKNNFTGEANARKLRNLLPKLRTHKRFSDPNKDYKQLRDELYDEDPKYKHYRKK